METLFLTHVSEFGVFLIHSWSLNFSFKESMGKRSNRHGEKPKQITNLVNFTVLTYGVACAPFLLLYLSTDGMKMVLCLKRWTKADFSDKAHFFESIDWVYDSLWLMYWFKSCVLKYLFWGQLGQLVLFILSSASVSCSVATVQQWHQLFYFKHTRVWVWKRWSKYLNCMAIWASTSQDHTTSLHTNKLSHTA